MKCLLYTRSARSRKKPKLVNRLSTECLHPLSVHVQINQFCSFVVFSFSLLCSLLVGWQIRVVIGEWWLRWIFPEGGVTNKITWNQQGNFQEGPWQDYDRDAKCLLPSYTSSNRAAMRLLFLHVSMDCNKNLQSRFKLLSRAAHIREAERQSFKGTCSFPAVPLISSSWVNKCMQRNGQRSLSQAKVGEDRANYPVEPTPSRSDVIWLIYRQFLAPFFHL